MQVDGLIGAQYGSEGKGAIAYAIANNYDAHVRVGAPNAGHTFYHEGRKFVARSIPCGWVNPNAEIFIGAGAIIDLDLLKQEFAEIEAAGYTLRGRMYVDRRASVLLSQHHAAEGGTSGTAHQMIGSTGEGVGMARIAKINRGSILAGMSYVSMGDLVDEGEEFPFFVTADTFKGMRQHNLVLIEGAQGSGLSLTHGVWPYCTSTDTNFAQMLSDTGLAPKFARSPILVARTFPIRVAGNSGPLAMETDWQTLGLPPERTTVTKKIRRVGRWDEPMLQRAIDLNGAHQMAITFIDYIWSEAKGVTTWEALPYECRKWITGVEARLNVTVGWVGTGPDTVVLR